MSLDKTYLFRMTHIENIPHIIENGITHKASASANPNYTPIGDSSLIGTRNEKSIFYKSEKDKGHKAILIGEFIPFYFGFRTPMLYVIQNGYNAVIRQPASNIVYIVCTVQKIIDADLIYFFTNGHAIDTFSSCYDRTMVNRLIDLVDIPATQIRDWTFHRDAKRKMEAEFLVKGDVPISCILGYCCYDDVSKERLLSYGIVEEKILIKPNYYF